MPIVKERAGRGEALRHSKQVGKRIAYFNKQTAKKEDLAITVCGTLSFSQRKPWGKDEYLRNDV
ncbi:hypothetical protein [Bordetella genomosp. 10]|uniref:hypothetical protein n=1 Tax=Bordetella genomosp. 10 TaxID=1416804 RepID=UPI00117739C8|nr:hypothetical protein [Bordetella genomosp. 10]